MVASASESRRDPTAAGFPGSSSLYRSMHWRAFGSADDLLRRRVKARAIDMGLVLVPVAVLQLVFAVQLALLADSTLHFDNLSDLRVLFSELGLVFASFCLSCVFLPMLPAAVVITEVIVARRNGQTLGKKDAGVCVRYVGEGGVLSVPSVGRVVARAAVLYVPVALVATVALVLYGNEVPGSLAVMGAIPVYVFVAIVPVLFTSRRRGLHDRVAGTVVVAVPVRSPGSQPTRQTTSAGSVTRSPRVRFSLRLAFRGLWRRRR